MGEGRPGPLARRMRALYAGHAEPPARVHEQADKAEGRHLRPVAGGDKIMKPAHAKPPAIIFDWDNTLVDSWDTIHEALVITFAAMGHKPLVAGRDQAARAAQPARTPFRHCSASAGTRRGRSISIPMPRSISTASRPLPGAEALLRDLQARGSISPWSATRPGPACAARPRISAGRAIFARLVGAGDASRRQARRRAGSTWRSKAAASQPGAWSGMSATPRSTWNAPNAAGATGVLLGEPLSRRGSRLSSRPACVFRAATSLSAISQELVISLACRNLAYADGGLTRALAVLASKPAD